MSILHDYKIALTGSFDYGNHQMIEKLIQQYGGEILSEKQICEVNLLIVGNKTEAITILMTEASMHRISIVNENWLVWTIDHQQIADFEQFLWKSKFVNIIFFEMNICKLFKNLFDIHHK